MNEKAATVTALPKISKESARDQVMVLFDAFEQVAETEQELRFVGSLSKAVRNSRLEINGTGDDVKITQHLKNEVDGKKSIDWNWSRLGLGKSRVKLGSEGLAPFGQNYTIASPMTGLTVETICTMHPVDLSLLEDIAGFFQLL